MGLLQKGGLATPNRRYTEGVRKDKKPMTQTKNLNEYEFLTFKTDRRTKGREVGEPLHDGVSDSRAQTYFEGLPNKPQHRRSTTLGGWLART
jgi:hypothetical protein